MKSLTVPTSPPSPTKMTSLPGKMKILITIPTYNNASTIADVIEKVLDTPYDVIVINDGCTDHTEEIIRSIIPISSHRLQIISHSKNKGKGAAISTAANWAKESYYTHLITIDADGQHNPSEVSKFIPLIEKAPYSLIVGARDFAQSDIPKGSRFGRKLSNFWLKVACGRTIPDSQSGFRAYPVYALTSLRLRNTRYNFEIEVLAKAVWAGFPLESVDISVHYSKATRKASHFRCFLDNFRISVTYAKLVLRNFIPIPHKILYGSTLKEKIFDFFFKPIETLKMLIKERTSAKELAFASMLGVFLGVLPLFATHTVAILFCATRLKLNRLVAVNMQHICMPPIVPAICVETGYFAINGKFLTDFNLHTLGYQFFDRVGDYLLGTIIVAPILAIAVGIIIYIITSTIYWKLEIQNIK